MINCLIIGSGPAGYTAAIYAARANLSPVLFEGQLPGGQLTTTTEVENFPGYPNGVQGHELMADLAAQAKRFGAKISTGRITEVDFTHTPLSVVVNGKERLEAKTIIICTGAYARYLGIPDEKKYIGMGVSTCAVCDGSFYRDRNVAVVGGGDTACEEASYLSSIAKKVYLIVRKDHLRASKVMQQRVLENKNIEVLFNTNTVGLYGDEFLEGAHLVVHKGTEQENYMDIAIDGIFMAIGHKPNTDIFEGQLELDAEGYIVTKGKTTATSVPGVFAAGDVADPLYKQAISAAGSGCRAALDVDRYLHGM